MAFIRVSYMSMRVPPVPRCGVPRAPDRCAVARREMDVEAYLQLYRAVGGPWGWDQRLEMDRARLAAFLAGPDCDIYCVGDRASGGRPLGFCEIDNGGWPDVQLMNFGLVPEALGRGLGPWLLATALAETWTRRRPQRIWLHTDDNDHPRARETYLRAGFVLDEERWQDPAGL